MKFINPLAVALTIVGFTPNFADAANRYVRPGATGTGTGADWSNAYTNLPSSLVRGDTYYLADGSFGSYVFDDANNGTAVITLKKATATDHGSETGWNPSYGDGQAIFRSWQIYSDSYTFDGQVRNPDWRTGATSQYGIRVAGTGPVRLDNGGGTGGDNLTFRFVDIQGGGRDTGSGDDVIYGLTSNSNITFQNCALRDSDRTIFLTRGTPSNWLVEYSYIARNASSPAVHGEIMSSTASSNMTWRYNVIEDPEGTAVWAFINGGTATNWSIYGNVIFHSSGYNREGISGVVFVANDASNNNTMNGLRYYNNTHWGIKGLWSGVVVQRGTDNIVENNIWSQSVTPNNSGGSYNYNTYFATTTQFDNNAQTVTTQPLINPGAKDFGLARATVAGRALAPPLNVDPNQVTRGADGTWDRGAFEFGGTELAPPRPPENVRVE